jgi:hypothetical protein
MAVLPHPVVFSLRASNPTAELFKPVVLHNRAESPKAAF